MTWIGTLALMASFGITAFTIRRISIQAKPEGGDYWKRVGLFFGLMLAGMLAREAYNMLVISPAKPFNWTSLAIGAIVSPMVFGAIYANLGNLEMNAPSVILAFQNGFFWNAVFENLGPTS